MLHIVPCGYCELVHVSKLALFSPGKNFPGFSQTPFKNASIKSKAEKMAYKTTACLLYKTLPISVCLEAATRAAKMNQTHDRIALLSQQDWWLWPLNDLLTLHPVEARNNECLSSYTQICFLLSYFKEISSVRNSSLQNVLQQPNSSGWKQCDLSMLMPILFVYESYMQNCAKLNSC